MVFDGKAHNTAATLHNSYWQKHESFRQSYCGTQSSMCVGQEVEPFSGKLVGSKRRAISALVGSKPDCLYLGASGDQQLMKLA
jgi:hypothetical protein